MMYLAGLRCVVSWELAKQMSRRDRRDVARKVHMSMASQRVRSRDSSRTGRQMRPISNPNPPMPGQVVDIEDRTRVLRYSVGVSYKKPTTEKAPLKPR